MRVRVCELPVRRPEQSAEDHKANVGRHIRIFHADQGLPSSLPAKDHLVLTPRLTPIVVRSLAQRDALARKLERPVLLTLSHEETTTCGPSCWPASWGLCTRVERQTRILYAVAQLTLTEQRRVIDRVNELLAPGADVIDTRSDPSAAVPKPPALPTGRRFTVTIDFSRAVCEALGSPPPHWTDTGCSSERITVEGGALLVVSDDSLHDGAPRDPSCGHWCWGCPCALAQVCGQCCGRSLCAGIDDVRYDFPLDRSGALYIPDTEAAAVGAGGGGAAGGGVDGRASIVGSLGRTTATATAVAAAGTGSGGAAGSATAAVAAPAGLSDVVLVTTADERGAETRVVGASGGEGAGGASEQVIL